MPRLFVIGPVTQAAFFRLRDGDPEEPWHSVHLSSFADPEDVKKFLQWKSYYLNQGMSDKEATDKAFAKGDNGVGAWGDDTTTTEIPMVALSPAHLRERWGTTSAGSHQKVVLK